MTNILEEEKKEKEKDKRTDLIEEYLDKGIESKNKPNKIIFENRDMNQKTELSDENINVLKIMITTNEILKKNGLFDMYSVVINAFENTMVSRDRKGRGEFVQINTQNNLKGEIQNTNEINKLLGK